MKTKIYSIALIIGVVLLAGCKQQQNTAELVAPTPKTPKNIILMIGDGMGLSQVTAAHTAKKGKLEMARCKHTGFCTTSSNSDYVTDSAASGTALATGSKTNNGVIGIDAMGDTLKSVLEMAEEHGLATGLVATSKITHATPAAFIGHNESRNNYDALALDFLKTDIDVFIGGGRNNFDRREDSLDLTEKLINNHYTVANTLEEIKAHSNGKLAGLLYPDHPNRMLDGRGQMLMASSEKAVELLNKNNKGFFLMIEGSQIDWGGHDMSSEYVLTEAVDFDNVVGKILDFAERDGETLVIITADHECGGYALMGGNREEGTVDGQFVAGHHSATMVPVFAFGPGAEQFTGIIDNTDIFKKMVTLFGF